MRVEMRQITEREEAKFLGGCGICGQELCCRRFSNQIKLPNIKMAKIQGKSPMLNKVNGVCGKLMCCMQYEYDDYREALKTMTPIGSRVKTEAGEGIINELDCLNYIVTIKLDKDGSFVRVKQGDFTVLKVAKGEDDE